MVIIELSVPKAIDWSPSYIKESKNPFGTFLIYKHLPELFPSSKIKLETDPVLERYHYFNNPAPKGERIHFFLNSNIYLDSLEVNQVFNWLYDGQTVFISSNRVPKALEDSLKLKVEVDYQWANSKEDTVMIGLEGRSNKQYQFNARNNFKYFFDSTSIDQQILGSYGSAEPYYIRQKVGNAYLYLHLQPSALSNYALLQEGFDDYIAEAFSYLPDLDLHWDRYYKDGRIVSRSPLRVVNDSPALRYALWILTALLLIYMIFFGKRRQRVIPVVKAPINESVDFTRTISQLYQKEANHIELARKKIQYLKDFIRRKFYFYDFEFETSMLEKLSGKTGIPEEEWIRIFKINETIQNNERISPLQLKSLNDRINKIYSLTSKNIT